MEQQFCLCAIVATFTMGAAFPAYPPHPPALYHPPPPAPYHPPAPHYPDVTPKYEYKYDVNDDYQKVMFDKMETRDGYKTAGSYSVRLPDGRKQTVTYADNGDGLEAEVTYEGDIAAEAYPTHPHPPPTYPRQPYFPVYPSHPAPSAAIQAEPEAVNLPEVAPIEENDASPVNLVEAPAEDETPAEDVEEEAAASVEAEEEEVTSPLEEEEVEITTLPPEV